MSVFQHTKSEVDAQPHLVSRSTLFEFIGQKVWIVQTLPSYVLERKHDARSVLYDVTVGSNM